MKEGRWSDQSGFNFQNTPEQEEQLRNRFKESLKEKECQDKEVRGKEEQERSKRRSCQNEELSGKLRTIMAVKVPELGGTKVERIRRVEELKDRMRELLEKKDANAAASKKWEVSWPHLFKTRRRGGRGKPKPERQS